MEIKWHSGMTRKEEKEFFSVFLETLRSNYNFRHRPRLFNFKWRKEPEPEPWRPVYDDMVLSYLTPKEIKQYEEAGETKKDMVDRAKGMIFDQAWNDRKRYEEIQNEADLLEKKEAFRKKFEKDPVYHTLSIVAYKEKLRSEYSGKPEAWEYPDVLAQKAEEKRNEHLMPVKYLMMSSPTGRRSWELLKLGNYSVDFDTLSDNAVCNIDQENKAVTLNLSASKEACALSLVRSARLLQRDVYSADRSVEIMKTREADAVSAQLAFAEEMQRKSPRILETFKQDGNESLCGVYDRTFAKTKDSNAARSAVVDSCLSKTLPDRKPSPAVLAEMCRNEYGLSYYVPPKNDDSNNTVSAIRAKAKQLGR